MIDLSPSLYSYNSSLDNIIINTIPVILDKLLCSLFDASFDNKSILEIGIICVRTPNEPLHVVVQSYKLQDFDQIDDIVDQFKDYLDEISVLLDGIVSDIYNNPKNPGVEFATTLK